MGVDVTLLWTLASARSLPKLNVEGSKEKRERRKWGRGMGGGVGWALKMYVVRLANIFCLRCTHTALITNAFARF